MCILISILSGNFVSLCVQRIKVIKLRKVPTETTLPLATRKALVNKAVTIALQKICLAQLHQMKKLQVSTYINVEYFGPPWNIFNFSCKYCNCLLYNFFYCSFFVSKYPWWRQFLLRVWTCLCWKEALRILQYWPLRRTNWSHFSVFSHILKTCVLLEEWFSHDIQPNVFWNFCKSDMKELLSLEQWGPKRTNHSQPS